MTRDVGNSLTNINCNLAFKTTTSQKSIAEPKVNGPEPLELRVETDG